MVTEAVAVLQGANGASVTQVAEELGIDQSGASRFISQAVERGYLRKVASPVDGGQVVSMAVIVATGVTATGEREILGLDVGDSEDEVFWRGFLLSLKQRGLAGVRLVISDQHCGLVKALKRAFQGVAHQRCRVHFARNLLAYVPKGQAELVATAFWMIFAQPTAEDVHAAWDKTRDELAARFPKLGPLMDDAKAEVLAFTAFPREHWRKIWSTDPLSVNRPSDDTFLLAA